MSYRSFVSLAPLLTIQVSSTEPTSKFIYQTIVVEKKSAGMDQGDNISMHRGSHNAQHEVPVQVLHEPWGRQEVRMRWTSSDGSEVA